MKKYITMLFVVTFAVGVFATTIEGKRKNRQVHIYVVNQKDLKASDSNSGSEELPFKTISAAAKIAKAGDTVIVHEGVYRERVTPSRGGADNAPVTYMSAPGESVYIKGSDILKPQWKSLGDNIYEGSLDSVNFTEENPFKRTISISNSDKSEAARPIDGDNLPETLGQVFVNSSPYLQVMSYQILKKCSGTWMVNRQGDSVLINFKSTENIPDNNLVEISVRSRIFSPYRRGLCNIPVTGVLPGPFQNIDTNSLTLPLINVITNPVIRMIPAQKEQKMQSDFIENETEDRRRL